MAKGKSAPKQPGRVRSVQWWRAKEKEVEPHVMLKALLDSIQKDQRHRYEAYKHWARCLDADMSAVDGTELSYQKFYGSELTINEALNTLETLHAQVFKNKILPQPCPSEGDYEDEFQARAFGRWLEGVLDDTKAYRDAIPQAGWDCLWAGTGFIKGNYRPVKGKHARVVLEAVSPRHMYVDLQEARGGKPRSIHQKIYMDRWVVYDLAKNSWDVDSAVLDKIASMEETQSADVDMDVSYKGDGDQITVWESWHLPSGPSSGDGKHVIWINEATLFEEEWKFDRFPFTILRFGQREAGFWGKSAFARILPAQKAFDRLTKQIDEAHNVMGIPRIIMRKGTGLTPAHVDDLPFTVLETEAPPESAIKEWNAQPIHPSTYQERDSLTRRMKSAIGVSDFESTQQLPPNIRDGAAAYIDRQVEEGQARHAMLHQQFEEAMMDLSDLALIVALDAEDKGYNIIVKAPGNEMKTTVEMLSFSDVKMKRDRLKMRVLPMNKLARSMADRIKDLTLLRDRGDISQKTYLRLLEVPDIESEIDNYVSDEDIIRRNLAYMIRTGEYISPLPYDNLDLIVKLTAQKVNEVRVRDVEDKDDKVALLLQYIEDALELKKGIAPPAPPAPMVPPGMPPLGPPPDPSQAFAPAAPPMPAGPGGPPPPAPGPALPYPPVMGA